MAPSSSAKQVVGRRKTSVWMSSVLTSFCSPWFFQKVDVSVTSGSMMTRNLSFDSDSMTLFLFGNEATGLKPWHM